MSDIFHIYTDISFLPVNEHEAYLKEGFGGICTAGTAIIEVFSVRRQISKNDIVTILPLQLASIHQISDDFSMTFFKVDKVMFLDIMSGLGKITPDFFFYMRKNFVYALNDGETQRFLGFCHVLAFRGRNDDPVFCRETILHLLRIYYWDFYVYFQRRTSDSKNPPLNSNKENIAFKFGMLVSEHYSLHREIAFYADKLCISPVYLTKVVQEMNGQSPYKVIADYVIVEIKMLLRNPNFGIKDVVGKTGFSNQSSLSRFFRQHTGMSPSEYRRTVHVIR
ncbi:MULTISPECIES: helix-turn-helix domain-containing protein [Sanguibacteroides]|uniref:AraC family transcriptional regulator n=1 Tax=Sanguibacteroides justesenii TaxID=1547597 RepID=A0A0C3RDB4_9PORP|nr:MULTISPECIES: helix-turn-helix domain-containing protein [Sanguibacteroides]KIO44201.1 AraC family transcriptional regulator [Sanguibacteroides justesenii]